MREFLGADGGRPPEPSPRPDASGAADVPAANVLGERTGAFGARRVPLDHELSPDVALLCVKANAYGPRSFELHFHHGGEVRSANGRDALDKQQAHPELALSRLKADVPDEEWKRLFHWIGEWSGYQFALNCWLRDLLMNAGAQLIVFDVTGYEIPWELFRYEPPPGAAGPDGWLGALVPVSRWTSLPHDTQEWHLGAAPREMNGGLLMMEDAAMRTDVDVYADFEVAGREQAIKDLVRRLEVEEELLAFSLLMIRCHGEWAPGERLTLNGVVLEELIERRLPVLRRNGAVVLLNACISGRPITDDREHLRAPTRGFAQKFLREGASAVIATLGDVDLDHSHEFAVEFVADAAARDQNLARYLRDYRADVARRMRPEPGRPDTRTPDDYRMFFWSFMYVYYGHPDTTLRLIRAASP
ncbi:CHAT domain-containing protein [Actinomadura madurae]|uniref:CHAT domain-containing protein n=1 Tax=Actinomadura madurae TaxID=1993 RepID=A0A1I5MHF4_9ACTN|nr:CHAT domain-containing protein [Actinomadura madurae]SFP08747.1 CHAT domain-containing protein [Actinomadura madurae]